MQRLRSLLPGSALCAVVALAASFVAQLHGGPPLLYALMMGMTLHAFGEAGNASAGVEFASSFILRLGVALLGARITAEQVMALGWPTVALVLAAVASTIGLGIVLARWLGLSGLQGLLSGGATAICGASAALAIAAVLPRSREQDRFTLLVVVCVSTLSTLAMLLYPPVARLLGLPPALAGLFIGASIHDVAQVVGAGYQLGTQAGDAAVIVKLLRVSLLVWVVLGVSVVLSRRAPRAPGGARRRLPGVPWFLTAFVALAVLNSLHGIPDAAQPVLSNVSRACLVVAIAALGLKTALPSLAQAGWRPLVLLLCETLWIAAFTLIGVAVLSARGLPA